MSGDGIAIVGMAGIFPGARDLGTFWQNLRLGVDAIREVPSNRWDPAFYDPTSNAPDRFYCRRGGFIDEYADFDPSEFGVMPREAEGAEPDQLLVLKTAALALADAGYERHAHPGERTGIIIGRGNYIGAGMTRLEQNVRTPDQLLTCLRLLLPAVDETALDLVKETFQVALGHYAPDTAIGLVPNLTASRVANRLNLLGPAFTVDAACASSLVATAQACDALVSGSSDLMLAGGVHLSHDVAFWSVFCQLGALSRAQQIRPFDRRADGLLIGEGLGVVVLKRMCDARRDGDRVYAVIRGWGVASDGRQASLMNPRPEGQILALSRAWAMAAEEPRTVGLVEGHGTGTPIGDGTEIETLRRFFGSDDAGFQPVGLGSVKSMIGHTMPAAGAAGLIKAALAVFHGTHLPTLHSQEPHPALANTRFHLFQAAESWEGGPGPRRAGVNAFGFGGINAHLVLESSEVRGRKCHTPTRGHAKPSLLTIAAQDAGRLLVLLQDGGLASETGPCRVAIVDPTPSRMAQVRSIVERGRPWRGRDGIWFSPEGLLTTGGQLVMVFPGVDAAFNPRFEGIGSPDQGTHADLEKLGVAVFGFNRIMHEAISSLGVRPDAFAGHSIGEWNGIVASGMLPAHDTDAFIGTLQPGTLEVPDVVYLAAGCGADMVSTAISGLDGVSISHDNCPHQTVLSGLPESIATASHRLRKNGVFCQELRFRSGFHSPLLRPYLTRFEDYLDRIDFSPPSTPLWSATTCDLFPAEPEEIRSLVIDHLVRPVRFRELILKLHESGFRVFVQSGSGSLPGFIEDTLRGRPAVAISANSGKREGVEQLAHLAAALFVEGLDINPDAFPAPKKMRGTRMVLSLGVPLVKPPFEPLNLGAAKPEAAESSPSAPGLSEFEEVMGDIAAAISDVRLAQVGGSNQTEVDWVEERIISVDQYPCLLDHCFFRQAAGSTNLAERFPVVPITMSVDMMVSAAQKAAEGRVGMIVEDVRSKKWMAAASPVTVDIRCAPQGGNRVHVSLGDYVSGTVQLGGAFPASPEPRGEGLEGERLASISSERLYKDGWMFHGRSYQGLSDLGPLGSNGIRGTIVAGEAPGAVLDNAGQLLGFWIMLSAKTNRLAMPIGIQRIEFFGPPPDPGTRLQCVVWIREVTDDRVLADMEVSVGQGVWVRVYGWEDRRFDTDERIWPLIRQPERRLLALIRQEGFALFHDRYRAAHSRDYLARRFLSAREMDSYLGTGPRRRRQWLAGRIAAKDAVRAWMWDRGYGPTYPAQIIVQSDSVGRPEVTGPFREDLRLSISHKDDIAVALVRDSDSVGIDIERVSPRPEGFVEAAFTPREAEMLPSDFRDLWITKFFSAKEAAAKAAGQGLTGDLSRFPIEGIDGNRIVVGGGIIETICHGDYVVSWTPGAEMP